MEETSPEKINRITFNEMRGFRTVKNISKVYEFKQKLGAGQFGSVYEGYHPKAQVKCAIKIIDKKKAKKSEVMWELMMKELEALQ